MPDRKPSLEDITALTRAVVHNFPNCDCHVRSGIVHACPAHSFVQEIDRIVPRWQKLLFYRAIAPALIEQEQAPTSRAAPTPPPVDPRGRLPW